MGKKLTIGFITVGITVFISVLMLTGCPAKAPVTYTVTYDANGADGGTVPTEDSVYEEGQTVTVLGNTGSLVKTGSAFSGWNTAADGSGDTYTEGQSFEMGALDVTLYAAWGPTYTVTYHANGADSGSVPVDNNLYAAGQPVNVPGGSDLVRNNNLFSGWTENADGRGTAYLEGDSLTMGAEDMVLYAKWMMVDYINMFQDADAGLTGLSSSSSSFADVDGDGDQDLVIAGSYDALLYINDGSGNFTEDAGAGLTGVNDCSCSFADVDGDGDQDLVITGFDGSAGADGYTAILYSNDGDGNFTDAGAGLTGVRDGSSSFADVDGDGDQDLVIIGYDSADYTAILYINDGDGNFSDAGAGLTGVDRGSISFADVDGDGDQDLVITGLGSTSPIAVLYTNDGAGNFTDAAAGLTGVRGSSSSFADIDRDGDQDLVITGEDSGTNKIATLYINDGDGNFTEDAAAGLTGVDGSSSCFDDVDGDGDQDLLITGSDSTNRPTIALYSNDGEGNYFKWFVDMEGTSSGSSSFADVDGDGDQDIVVTGRGNSILYTKELY